MAVLAAVPTDALRALWPKVFVGQAAFAEFAYFRIGEGGWIDPGGGKIRRAPDRTLVNLDLILDPGRAGPSQRYADGGTYGYFQKSFSPLDFTFESPSTLKIHCLVDFTEYNSKNALGATLIYDNGGGVASPDIWEIGAYDSLGTMLLYATFPKETKTPGNQILKDLRLVF